MKNIALLVTLYTSATFAGETVEFDKALATEISAAYLRAYFRMSPSSEPYDIEYINPTIATAIDGNARKFVFVGFANPGEKRGASMHLEVCGSRISLQPSWYGPTLNIEKDLTDFKGIVGNKSADYPGGCYESE